MANAIQSGGERNPIRQRTDSNQTANTVRPQTTNIHRLNEAIIKMLKRWKYIVYMQSFHYFCILFDLTGGILYEYDYHKQRYLSKS